MATPRAQTSSGSLPSTLQPARRRSEGTGKDAHHPTVGVSSMRRLSLLIIAATGVGLVAVGLRYLLADELMPYHAQVAQTTWADLQPGVRTIIRGMLTIIGAGFIACGAAFLWILPAAKAGERWAPWALLCIGLLIGVPTLYV